MSKKGMVNENALLVRINKKEWDYTEEAPNLDC